MCPPPNNIEQEENTMFHGSTLGKIITLVNVVDEKRPSGCTRKKATYTICTGKDGYGKNGHFCNIDLSPSEVWLTKPRRSYPEVITSMSPFGQRQKIMTDISLSMLKAKKGQM